MSVPQLPLQNAIQYINAVAAELRQSLLSKVDAQRLYTPLGTTTNLNTEVATNTANITTLQQDQIAIAGAAEPIAPPGLRDLWQNASQTGTILSYIASTNTLYADGLHYSTNGGLAWSPVVYNISPGAGTIIGYNGANLWVALVNNGGGATLPYTSSDGINFTAHTAFPNTTFIYGTNVEWFASAGLFVVFALSGSSTLGILTSSDGITWTPQTTPTIGTIDEQTGIAVSHGSICVVAIGSSGNVLLYSMDGIAWNVANGGPSSNANGLVYSPDRAEWFVQAGFTGQGYRSTDGINWSSLGVVGDASAIQVIWVPTFERYYMPTVDAYGNYSLRTTYDLTIPFEGSFLDGATPSSHVDDQTMVYIPQYNRFLIGGAIAAGIGYSTARPFDIKAVSDNIRVLGFPVIVSNYSTYADTTVASTTTETNLSTTASSLGTLTLATQQPQGMVINFAIGLLATSSAGDTLTIRIKTQSATMLTLAIAVPATSTNLPITINARFTVEASNLRVLATAIAGATNSTVISGFPAYTRTQANTFSVTGQWGAAVNSCTMNQLLVTSAFPNGA
jgi:hypothetical protein